jgi:hypothetical protein
MAVPRLIAVIPLMENSPSGRLGRPAHDFDLRPFRRPMRCLPTRMHVFKAGELRRRRRVLSRFFAISSSAGHRGSLPDRTESHTETAGISRTRTRPSRSD